MSESNSNSRKRKHQDTFKTIKGVKYDKGMLDVVEEATKDSDKLTVDDCRKLYEEVVDGDVYTDIEKATMRYIRENYKFDPIADQWIRREIASWTHKKAKKDKKEKKDEKKEEKKEEKQEELWCSCNNPSTGRFMIACDAGLTGCYSWYHGDCVGVKEDDEHDVWFCPNCKEKQQQAASSENSDLPPKKASYYKQINHKKYDKGMLDAAEKAAENKSEDGKITVKAAKEIFKEAIDGDRITDIEYSTLEYIKEVYKWTPKAENWLKKALLQWEENHPNEKAENKEVADRREKKAKEQKDKKDQEKKEKKEQKDREQQQQLALQQTLLQQQQELYQQQQLQLQQQHQQSYGLPPVYAHYPHIKLCNGLLYLSGAAAVKTDGSFEGVQQLSDGNVSLDVAAQTHATIENIRRVLATAGADLSHLVDVTCFLTDMKNYDAFNKVYNSYFSASSGPTRTTVAVRELPHRHLAIEIKGVAIAPSNLLVSATLVE